MAAAWCDEETIKLVEIWGDEEIQALLEGCTRNNHIYDKIARGMVEAGYERSGVQCRDKIKKLKGEYKKVKDHNNETGKRRKAWKLYDCMNEVLGNKPATRPPIVIDSLEDVVESDGTGDEEVTGADVDNVLMPEDDANGDGGTNKENEVTGEKKDDDVKVEQVEKKPRVKKEKQKKRTRDDKFEKTMDGIVEKLTKSQKESDKMFMELEEKRMKLEERMMEMEDHRFREDKEREECQRREEREFQFKMMMMQQGGLPPPPLLITTVVAVAPSSGLNQRCEGTVHVNDHNYHIIVTNCTQTLNVHCRR